MPDMYPVCPLFCDAPAAMPVHIHSICHDFLRVPPLRRVTFSKRRKSNQKGFPPAYGTSLRLSVPSLRCPSGGIAYGLLRCTSSRCMRLRRMALRAFPLMDTFARPAEGAKIKSQIKSQSQSQSQSQSRSKDRSLRQLLHGIGYFQLGRL